MNWKSLIQAIIDSGLSEYRIVAWLKSEGITLNQSTLNRIKSGDIREPRFDVGAALIKLHAQVARHARAEAEAAA